MKAVICNITPQEDRPALVFSRSYVGPIRIHWAAPGEAYALTEIPDITYDKAIDSGEGTYFPQTFNGEDVARDLIDNEYLGPMGLFVCAGTKPTKAELEQAEATRKAYWERLVAEADGQYAKNPQLVQDIKDEAKRAAKVLNLQRPWCFSVVAHIACPGCGEQILPQIAKHTCGAVVSIDKASALGMITPEEAKRLKMLRKQMERQTAKPEAEVDDEYTDAAEAVAAAK